MVVGLMWNPLPMLTASRSWRSASVLGCLILTGVVANTCLQIEYWNQRAGGYLPRTDVRNGIVPKWCIAYERALSKSEEQRIRYEQIERHRQKHGIVSPDDENRILGRPLTAEEERRIARAIDSNRPNTILRGWVGGPGLWQYVLAPGALIWSLVIVAKAEFGALQRLIGTACALIAAVCWGFAFYREYLTSLGW
jgi:hypothetical protein